MVRTAVNSAGIECFHVTVSFLSKAFPFDLSFFWLHCARVPTRSGSVSTIASGPANRGGTAVPVI